MKRIQRLFAFVLMAIMLSGVASALPLTIDSVEVDDVELSPNAVNRFDLERNAEYEVEVLVTATEDLEDVEVELKISGFEYNDVSPIYATSHVKDLDANVTYKFRLTLRLPDEVEEDTYRLRLRITNRDGDATEQYYNLKLDVPRHRVVIEDVIYHPGGSVMAGQGLLVTVRLENQGENEEEDVRVEVRIEDLGVSAVDYIDGIDEEDEEETEEMFLRVPLCAQTGTYPVDILVTYDNGYDHVNAKSSITVLENPRCAENMPVEPEVTQETVVVEPVEEKKEGGMRKALEVVLLALVALIVIVGLLIGFSKLRGDEEEF